MTEAATTEHRIRWYVWAGGQRLPRTARMRGTWGYDVECSCGWQTRTGGATRKYVEDQVWLHKHGFAD
jgi:N6-adenosine-specific RNA methylase IME4